MIAQEVRKLEEENQALKEVLKDMQAKMSEVAVAKPKSCQYCRYFIQHYMKDVGRREYREVYAGHCICDVPVKRRIKKGLVPDDSCQYFDLRGLAEK